MTWWSAISSTRGWWRPRPPTARRRGSCIEQDPPDLVVLDVMVPQINGLDLCSWIRSGSEIPVILLTARGEESDRITGLELGADDYVVKPFSPRELVIRIKAILRRTGIRQRRGA